MQWSPVLVLLCWGLVLGKIAVAEPNIKVLDFGTVPHGVYDTVPYYEPGIIGILFNMMQAFLRVVQPNPFPEDLVIKIARDRFAAIKSEYQKPENVVLTLQVIFYEIGFLVCGALGVLFIVLMPLVGLLFCLCRFCDNCGGEMHQRQRKNANCQKGLLATFLLTTTFIITAGVICAYTANQNLSSQLKTIRKLVNSNVKDIHTMIDATPMQIDYLIDQYSTAKKQVTADLNNVGPLLGGKIQDKLRQNVIPALNRAQGMVQVIRNSKEALGNVSVSLNTLQAATTALQTSLSGVRNSIGTSLSDPSCTNPASTAVPICNKIRTTLDQLDISANYLVVPSVSNELANVSNVMKVDLNASINKGFAMFNDIPAMVTTQTHKMTTGVMGLLDGIGNNITNISKSFPVRRYLYNVTLYINQVQSKIEDIYPKVNKIDFYRWSGFIVLCCIVVLILSFNFLGLLCGIIGSDRHATPTTRGCLSNTGGNLLMAGVGFSFLFSWLLMAVVTSTFLVGGNLEKLVCEPLHTGQLFKVFDTPFLFKSSWKNFIPGYLYNDSAMNISVDSVYSTCKNNSGIYTAFRLEKRFNMTTILNTTTHTKNVQSKFDNVVIDLRTIVLLEANGKQNLVNFSDSGISKINFASYLNELRKEVTLVDLLSYANDLDTQARLLPKGTVQTSLLNNVNVIRQIHSSQVLPLQQSLSTMNKSIEYLQVVASDLTSKVSYIIKDIDSAQYIISRNATGITSQEIHAYMKTIVNYFEQYFDWLKMALAKQVSPCKPVSNAVDSVEILTCNIILDSVNSFWFGLGCCTLFLLPSIILSVRLAKFYRRMDTEDVYDDMEIGNNGYYNERLQGIQNPVMTSIPAYDTMTRFPRASAPPRHPK